MIHKFSSLIAVMIFATGCLFEKGSTHGITNWYVNYAKIPSLEEDQFKLFALCDFYGEKVSIQQASIDRGWYTEWTPFYTCIPDLIGLTFFFAGDIVIAPLKITYGAISYPFIKESEDTPRLLPKLDRRKNEQ